MFDVTVKRIGGNGYYTIEGVFTTGVPYKVEGYLVSTFYWRRISTSADLANYLSKSGGMLSSRNYAPFALDNTSAGNIMIDFYSAGVRQGLLGFNAVNNPIFYDTNQKEHSLLHTGNKPSGSYTGNGSDTSRTISTGGIGEVCLVRSSVGIAFLTPNGSIFANASSGVIYTENATFSDGVITIKSANDIVNASGVTYHYKVL